MIVRTWRGARSASDAAASRRPCSNPDDDRFLVDRDLEAFHWEIGHASVGPPRP